MICDKHGMTLLKYCEQCRIAELEAELKASVAHGWDLTAQIEAVEAELAECKRQFAVYILQQGSKESGLKDARAIAKLELVDFSRAVEELEALQQGEG